MNSLLRHNEWVSSGLTITGEKRREEDVVARANQRSTGSNLRSARADIVPSWCQLKGDVIKCSRNGGGGGGGVSQ